MVSMDYLDDERKKIWAKLLELERAIDSRLGADEKEAKQASKKISEYKNKCEAAKNEAYAILDEIRQAQEDSKAASGLASQLAGEITGTKNQVEEIARFYDDLATKKAAVAAQIAELELMFQNHSVLSDKINRLDTIFTSADSYSSKINVLYNQLLTKKKELDELYFAIVGYSVTEEGTNKETAVPGLKHELELAYQRLKADFAEFSADTKGEVARTIDGWRSEYSKVLTELETLLPRGLTAGLSHAFSKKKEDEEGESVKLDRIFRGALLALVAISCIPFAVSYHQIQAGMALDTAILQLPRLVLSIFPLYIPMLWLAYSANRKFNLSKRLIEEYTHKEVLSKTFEGLARQIRDVQDQEISNDLRTKLLYNILEVSSENPGKLISDYDKADHPLMDALDKSVKLANAVEKLSRIPGMTKLSRVLEKKSQKALEDEARRADRGLEGVEDK